MCLFSQISDLDDPIILDLDYGHEDYGLRRIMVMVESGFYCYGSGFQDFEDSRISRIQGIQSEWVGRTT